MAITKDYPSSLCSSSAVISSSQTTSGAIDLAGTTIVGIQLPAAFTGTTLKFQAATSLSGTYQDVQDDFGAVLTKTVAAGRYVPIKPYELAGVQFLKIVSGSSESADRTLEIISRAV